MAEGNTPAEADRYPVIVGIGTSAGGIQALLNFFRELPAQSGAAYVVVVHLAPDAGSELPRILAQRASMPVVQVGKQTALQANTVYVIPPGRQLQLTDHEIAAVPFQEPRGQRAPIDMFFRSLSDKTAGVAIILTGAGSDGALGVKAIKEAGGVVMVQDPSEAEYPSMPRAAIGTGVADFVLPIRDLARRVVDVVRMKQLVDLPQLDELQDEEQRINILSFLRVRTGHDFSHYKRSTVLRRIIRRMHVTHCDSMRAYHEYMRAHPEEANELLSDLLISVTTFFRDRDAYAALARLMPQLFANAGQQDMIRVWVAGCATGEEAYSVGMMLLEEAGRHEPRPRLQVFASDLDSRALGVARLGTYPLAVEADVSEERLHRFFTREGDHYKVRQDLKDIILFTTHDLLKDPPFSHIDLISCPNVLIYLDRDLQELVLSTFSYALNPSGLLMLGSSEAADSPPGLFSMLDRPSRIYQTTLRSGEHPRQLPRLLGTMRVTDHAFVGGRTAVAATAWSEAARHRQVLEQVAPPSLLVNEHQRVVHLSDTAGRFLLPSGGPITGDAVELVRSELRFELRSALHRAFEQNKPTLSLPILVRFNGDPRRVHMFVQPAEREAQEPRQAVVMFMEGEAVDAAALSSGDTLSEPTIRRLTQELELTQQRLRTIREESEATNEELRAANEELQSINEEYRSTSEELETSKEELQSVNEELQTLNNELKIKLDTVSRAHGDLQNLMAASDFGTLFLDSSLRIKRVTDRVSDIFSVTASDEGRPLSDFSHKLEYGDLPEDLRNVLANLTPIRRELRGQNGHWFDLRLRPYRTVDDRIDGVVITFQDITERRESEEELRQNKQLIELARDPIFIWDLERGIKTWNRGSEELYGFTRSEAMGRNPGELLQTHVPGGSLAAVMAVLTERGTWAGTLQQRAKDGRPISVEGRLQLEVFDGRRLVLESTGEIKA